MHFNVTPEKVKAFQSEAFAEMTSFIEGMTDKESAYNGLVKPVILIENVENVDIYPDENFIDVGDTALVVGGNVFAFEFKLDIGSIVSLLCEASTVANPSIYICQEPFEKCIVESKLEDLQAMLQGYAFALDDMAKALEGVIFNVED